jgi:hypothetical protein
MLITVFIDESGTHDNSPLIMGGIGGRLGQWADFDTKWRRLLRDNNLPYFHSQRLSSSKEPFRGMTIAQKRRLISAVNKAVQRHTTWGFSACLHKNDYEEHYLAGHRPTKIQLDTMYGLCFRMCLSFAIDMAEKVVAWQNPQISFVLEAGHRHAGDAERIFDQVRKGVPELRDILVGISFVEKMEAYGVQGADAVAYSANMQEREGDLALVDFGPNIGIDAAKKQVRAKSPIFRLEGKPELLREMKDNMLAFRNQRSNQTKAS